MRTLVETVERSLDAIVDLREPRRIEDFLHRARAELMAEPAPCETCGETRRESWMLPATQGRNASGPVCSLCLGARWGYDDATERVTRYVLTSAVAGALATYAPFEVVRQAVNDALDDALRAEGATYGACDLQRGEGRR